MTSVVLLLCVCLTFFCFKNLYRFIYLKTKKCRQTSIRSTTDRDYPPILGRFSCTLREDIREREREKLVLFPGDVITFALLLLTYNHSHGRI